MKIAVLWVAYTDYLGAELTELHRRGHHIKLTCVATTPNTAFASKPEWLGSDDFYGPDASDAELKADLEVFAPDALLVCGWHIPVYRRIAKAFAGRATRILFMDNCWNETPKQWVGRALSRWYIRPLFEGVFLPGERQAQFAHRLGFADSEIAQGGNTADAAVFSKSRDAPRGTDFVFCGRLVDSKGVDVLARSYASYRVQVGPAARRLVVCGLGPLSSELEHIEGVELRGFVDAETFAKVLHDAAFLVLPSRFEPWALVIHEATLSGCGVIASSACGASVHLIRDLHNGRVIEVGSVRALSEALVWGHRLSDQQLHLLRKRSIELSHQFSPTLWADGLLRLIHRQRFSAALE